MCAISARPLVFRKAPSPITSAPKRRLPGKYWTRYFARAKAVVKEALDDKSLTPRQRLKRYLDLFSGILEDAKWYRGCLIGDFSL